MGNISVQKTQRVAELLLKNRPHFSEVGWPWLIDLNGKPASKKRANKFLLSCILDYQIPADTAWENARRLAEEYLGDPTELWKGISKFSESRWMSKFYQPGAAWKLLHRFPAAHKRVWRIGKDIVSEYQGDARKIWKGQTTDAVIDRLNELRVGPEISRMVVGALIDTGQIKGSGEVKADLHVRRVLGRVFTGKMFTPEEVHRTTKLMLPRNRWRLDGPLYLLGKKYCSPSNPNCPSCYLRPKCKFYMSKKR